VQTDGRQSIAPLRAREGSVGFVGLDSRKSLWHKPFCRWHMGETDSPFVGRVYDLIGDYPRGPVTGVKSGRNPEQVSDGRSRSSYIALREARSSARTARDAIPPAISAIASRLAAAASRVAGLSVPSAPWVFNCKALAVERCPAQTAAAVGPLTPTNGSVSAHANWRQVVSARTVWTLMCPP
jgi:hypothetical protein